MPDSPEMPSEQSRASEASRVSEQSRASQQAPAAEQAPAADTPMIVPAEPAKPAAPDGPAKPAPAQNGEPPRRRRWLWIPFLLLVALAAYYLWPKIQSKQAAGTGKAAKGSGKGGAAGGVIPVSAAKARSGNIGVYYTGLGAVTPLATVTIKTRVDGQLTSVRYKEGDMVKKGDLLVEIDDGPYQAALTQAEGTLTRDQALLDNARIDLARYQVLVPQKAVPEQMLATQAALVHQDEGTVKLDQGQVDAAKVNLAYCKIAAPVSGRIGLRLVDQGNIVQTSDTTGLVVITQMDPISVIFTISEDQLQVVLQKIAAGQTLEVDAYDRADNSKLAQGALTTLDNQVDPTTGTLKLRATFDNAKGTLFPNQFINARLLVQEKRGVTLVPTAAIQRNTNATYVYLVKPDSTVTVRNIMIGTTEGDDTEVTSGLKPGDVAVMTGVDKLEEGTKVNAQIAAPGSTATPAANPASNPPSNTTAPQAPPAQKGPKGSTKGN